MNKKENNEVGIGTKIISYIFIILVGYWVVSCNMGNSSGSSSGSKTCKSCGRTFSDTSNFMSIAKTGMCKNCYNNYNWGKAATGKGTAYHIENTEKNEIITLTFPAVGNEEYPSCFVLITSNKGWGTHHSPAFTVPAALYTYMPLSG